MSRSGFQQLVSSNRAALFVPFRNSLRGLLSRAGAAVITLALAACGGNPTGNENGQAQSTVKAAQHSSPMDKTNEQMLVDINRLFRCNPQSLKEYYCGPEDPAETRIAIYPIRDHVVETVSTGFPVQVPDKNYTRHPVEPPPTGFKLLRYLLPWWKDSDAWLRRAIAIGQGKGDVPYRCPMAAHWRGIYVVAQAFTSHRDSVARMQLQISRYHPSRTIYGFGEPERCPHKLQILEIDD